MIGNQFRKKAALILLSGVLALNSAFVYADTQDDLDSANEAVEQYQNMDSQLTGDLDTLTAKLDASVERVNSLNEQIASKQSDINTLNAEIEKLNKEQDEMYKSMTRRIQFVYESGGATLQQVLFTSDNFADFLNRAQYIQSLTEYDRKQLESISNMRKRQQNNQQMISLDLVNLQGLQNQANAEQEALSNLIAQKKTDIESNQQLLSKAQDMVAQFTAQLNAELAAQEAAAVSVDITNGAASVPVNASELTYLAATIQCEAGTRNYDGMIAVGTIIMNRLNSGRYGNSILSVVSAPGQFAVYGKAVFNALLTNGASPEATAAAEAVLGGARIAQLDGWCTSFRSASRAEQLGIVGTNIGGNVFF